MTGRVLVTDGDERAALAVVRSLGSAGLEVYVCSPGTSSLAGASRYCQRHFTVPDPLARPGPYIDAIDAILVGQGISILLPITEASLLALLPERERWAEVLIPFPPDPTFRAICDKRRVLEAAKQVGIAIPRQHVLEHATDLDSLRSGDLQFPLVLKPNRSVGESSKDRGKWTPQHVAHWSELQAGVQALPESAFPLLIQQRIVGPGTGIFLLLRHGQLVASFAHRRLREKPPAGGVSVLRESIVVDPGLLEKASSLLRGFGWEGVAMVEFKIDASTGEPYLMEVNGRFWGSLQLAIDAGVDFPRLLLQSSEDHSGLVPPTYRIGVRSRWEWGEIDHFAARLRRTNAELALPPGSPGRGRAFLDLLAFRFTDRSEVMRLSDPRPFAHETVSWLKGIFA